MAAIFYFDWVCSAMDIFTNVQRPLGKIAITPLQFRRRKTLMKSQPVTTDAVPVVLILYSNVTRLLVIVPFLLKSDLLR